MLTECSIKETGVVRKCDSLGRVVIPKEIIKSLKFKQKQPVDIYTDNEDVYIKKVNENCDSGFVRNIDDLNRVVIPKNLRGKLNIKDKTPFDILLKDDSIILRLSRDLCSICGGGGANRKIKNDKKICDLCLDWFSEYLL